MPTAKTQPTQPEKTESLFDEGKIVYLFTGAKGSGKTTAMVSFLRNTDYPKTFYVDTEDSASDIIRANKEINLTFGKYIRAYDRIPRDIDIVGQLAQNKVPWVTPEQKNAFLQFYNWFIKMLDAELTQGKYETLIIDTIEPLEAAITAYVEEKKGLVGWSGQKAYGRMETEGVRPLLDNLFEGIHRRGVKRILISSHVRNVWLDNKPVLNKVEPGGRLAVWIRISTGVVWLVQNPKNADGCPAGLMLKARFQKRVMGEDGFPTVQRILPLRMPHFSYRDMLAYEKNPADLLNPAEGEVPSDDEMEMMSEFLNDAQVKLMMLGAEQELRAQEQGNGFTQVLTESSGLSALEQAKLRKAQEAAK